MALKPLTICRLKTLPLLRLSVYIVGVLFVRNTGHLDEVITYSGKLRRK